MSAKTGARRVAAMAVGVVAMVAMGLGASPAGADPAYITRPTNVMSPQYEVNGCRYKVMYGNFGGDAYAQLRIYNPSGCVGSSISIIYNAGSGNQTETVYLSGGYGTGSDGCGSYRWIQATAPVTAYAIAALAALPHDPGGGWFNGWRFYSADGLQGQTAYSLC